MRSRGVALTVVELGEVFPAPDSLLEAGPRWARFIARAYARMGYDLVLLGDEDARWPRLVEIFRDVLRELSPETRVLAPPPDGSGVRIVPLEGTGPVVCLWAPVDTTALVELLQRQAQRPRFAFLHGGLTEAQRLARHLRGVELLVAGDGAKTERVRTWDGVRVVGPGSRGRYAALIRWDPQRGLRNYLLLPIVP
jgi:hypothetical protein